MIAFIEEHREACGVEPVRRVLPIAPSTCYSHAAVARDPGKASDRSKRDAETLKTVRSVHNQSKGRSGARKGLNSSGLSEENSVHHLRGFCNYQGMRSKLRRGLHLTANERELRLFGSFLDNPTGKAWFRETLAKEACRQPICYPERLAEVIRSLPLRPSNPRSD